MPGDLVVRVDIPNQLHGLGKLPRRRPDNARNEQRSNVVRPSPGHRAAVIVGRLEIEPAGDARAEVDEHVPGHGIRMSESTAMEIRQGVNGQADGALPQ